MRLEEYLEEKGWRAAQFCQYAKIQRNVVHNILHGRIPHLENAIKIVEYTKGKVSYKDLLKKMS